MSKFLDAVCDDRVLIDILVLSVVVILGGASYMIWRQETATTRDRCPGMRCPDGYVLGYFPSGLPKCRCFEGVSPLENGEAP